MQLIMPKQCMKDWLHGLTGPEQREQHRFSGQMRNVQTKTETVLQRADNNRVGSGRGEEPSRDAKMPVALWI